MLPVNRVSHLWLSSVLPQIDTQHLQDLSLRSVCRVPMSLEMTSRSLARFSICKRADSVPSVDKRRILASISWRRWKGFEAFTASQTLKANLMNRTMPIIKMAQGRDLHPKQATVYSPLHALHLVICNWTCRWNQQMPWSPFLAVRLEWRQKARQAMCKRQKERRAGRASR